MKINYKITTTKILFSLTLLFGINVWAESIIVEGIVPNQASKQTILAKMYSIYGADQIIDKIQVKAVNAPSGWSESSEFGDSRAKKSTSREIVRTWYADGTQWKSNELNGYPAHNKLISGFSHTALSLKYAIFCKSGRTTNY